MADTAIVVDLPRELVAVSDPNSIFAGCVGTTEPFNDEQVLVVIPNVVSVPLRPDQLTTYTPKTQR